MMRGEQGRRKEGKHKQVLTNKYKHIYIQIENVTESWDFPSGTLKMGKYCSHADVLNWLENSSTSIATGPQGLPLLSCSVPISDERQNILPLKMQINLPPQRHPLRNDKWRPWSVSSSELHIRITLSISGNFALSPIASSTICCFWLQKLILGSKANWRFEMILYWLFFFFF